MQNNFFDTLGTYHTFPKMHGSIQTRAKENFCVINVLHLYLVFPKSQRYDDNR